MAQYQPPETSSSARQSKQAPGSTRLAEKAEKTAQRLEDTAIERVQEARAQVEQRRSMAGERIRQFGDVLRRTGREAGGEDEFIGRYTELASDRIERIASYVSSANLRSLAHDAEDLARRKPVAFYGGSLLLGILAGRLAKGAGAGARKAVFETSGEPMSTTSRPRSESTTSPRSESTTSARTESTTSPRSESTPGTRSESMPGTRSESIGSESKISPTGGRAS